MDNIATKSIVLTAILALISSSYAFVQAQDEKHHWFLPNHPRMRRICKAAGFGAATGGIAAPFLGASAAAGAMAGASEHSAVRGWKDHHDTTKHKNLDSHWW